MRKSTLLIFLFAFVVVSGGFFGFAFRGFITYLPVISTGQSLAMLESSPTIMAPLSTLSTEEVVRLEIFSTATVIPSATKTSSPTLKLYPTRTKTPDFTPTITKTPTVTKTSTLAPTVIPTSDKPRGWLLDITIKNLQNQFDQDLLMFIAVRLTDENVVWNDKIFYKDVPKDFWLGYRVEFDDFETFQKMYWQICYYWDISPRIESVLSEEASYDPTIPDSYEEFQTYFHINCQQIIEYVNTYIPVYGWDKEIK